jgi:hypothetical protein
VLSSGSGLMGPRIRTLKPEIWHSADFLRLSWLGRLAFVTLITQADDEGRLKTDAVTLSTFLVPASADEVEAQLLVMEDRGMVRRYGGRDRQRYLQVVNWNAHQRIDRPTKSGIPPPPISKPRRALGDSSRSRARPRIGSDQTGSEGIRPEPPKGSPVANGDALVLTPPISLSRAEQVFDAWRQRWHPAARFTRERHAKTDARLRAGWTVEDLVLAATEGCANDPWAERNAGLNNDLKNLLRDDSTVEKFLELARTPLSQRMASGKSRAAQLDRVYAEAQHDAREADR